MKIEIQDKVLEVASTWNECNKEQRVEIIKVAAGGIDLMSRERWEYLIRIWLGVDWVWWKDLKLSFDVWERLKKEVSWVFEERLQVQPFVFFEHHGIKYYLPNDEDGLATAAAIDVSMGAIYLMQLSEGNMEAVDWLISVFCRPERKDLKRFKLSDEWNGDIREPYQDERVKMRAGAFVDLDEGVKIVVLKYLEGLIFDFLDGYKQMFGKDEKEPRYGDGRGWLYVLKTVAKAGYFRSLDEVWRASAGLVWGLMLDDCLDGKSNTEK